MTLRKRGGTTQLATIPSDNINIKANNPEYIVNKLVDSAIFKAGKASGQSNSIAGLYYLVDWKGYKEFECT